MYHITIRNLMKRIEAVCHSVSDVLEEFSLVESILTGNGGFSTTAASFPRDKIFFWTVDYENNFYTTAVIQNSSNTKLLCNSSNTKYNNCFIPFLYPNMERLYM